MRTIMIAGVLVLLADAAGAEPIRVEAIPINLRDAGNRARNRWLARSG